MNLNYSLLASFSSPEIGRSMESKEGNGTFCLHSFSLDGQRVKSVQLAEDIDRPICREDDGKFGECK
jgi:hypothetical protein